MGRVYSDIQLQAWMSRLLSFYLPYPQSVRRMTDGAQMPVKIGLMP